MSERRLDRNKITGAAIVREDESGVLRYVHDNGELSTSPVETRAPYEIEKKAGIEDVVSLIAPSLDFPEIQTQEEAAIDNVVRRAVLRNILN